MVDAVCADFESAPVSEKDKTLYRYVAKLNDAPATVAQEDVDACKAAGWSESAVYDASTVCSIFNYFNRWVDGAGVPDVPAGFYEERLATQGDLGYSM